MKITGWTQWQRMRRRALRATPGISLSLGNHIATHETRCRARMAKVVGKAQAKAIRLIVCRDLELGRYGEIQFLIVSRLDRETREAFHGIPELLWPIELRP
ncbi:hypothetical protein [Novosphingobium mathurense]|uniref:Uncharacterized protein n=1 Tax=Novosphingobium mathurense TaxID=428990 RepID=A0A1U6GXV6_9SPHN|nr:hypothetical protein [Novosphingobium mathurense]SLJ88363.1 hypothetical protein SAMN06295987_101796 [Novosphingobium mathurense]